MKNALLFSVAFFTVVLWAAKLNAQTTLIEYNYVTKGYKAQVIDQGGDLKSGYELTDVDKVSSGERTASLKKFTRSDGSIAAYMIVYRKEDDSPEYFCVAHPASEEEVLNLFFKSLDMGQYGYVKAQLISYLLSRTLSW